MKSLEHQTESYKSLAPVPVGRLSCVLLCSGFCALVFQIAWMREFRLFFGASTAAVGTVLAVFMGGLGLGNALLGKRCDRANNPLRLYAMFELGIAITAALSPVFIAGVSWVYLKLGGQLSLGLVGATAVRLLLAALVLGPPTILMGGTIPAAARSVMQPGDANRLSLSVLYATNTLGAVAGAAVSSFVLLESLGTRDTLLSAAMLNLLLGIVAWNWSRRLADRSSAADVQPPSKKTETSKPARKKSQRLPENAMEISSAIPPMPAFSARLIYAVAAIVGFAFFLMELVWYRMLGPILGGSTYSFGLILVVALFGIGLGSAAYRLVFRFLPVTLVGLAATCALEAVFLALPIALGDDLAMSALQYRAESETFWALVWGWTKLTGLIVLPASFISGLQFPMLIALLGSARDDVGRQTGTAFAFNTFGAIAGSLVGGFGILPWLTAPTTWRATVVLLALLAVFLLFVAIRRKSEATAKRLIAALVPGTAAVAAVFLATRTGPTAVWRHSGIGAGRAQVEMRHRNAVEQWQQSMRRNILWEAEGTESSIAIAANDGLALLVNGKSDGNSIGDAGTQIGLGMLGALLHPAPKRALVIGLGTGESAGWLADIAPIEQVDVVELEPAVTEMARRCADVNRAVMDNRKVRMIYNDAREVLLASQESYDLIVSEPSNPYRAGVATLYTREYYAAAANRLADHGLFLQWLQAYEIDDMTVAVVLKTLRTAFERVEIWQTKSRDLLLVCERKPGLYDEARLCERMQEPVIRDALMKGWMVRDLEGALARFLAGKKLVDQLTADDSVPINTDDRTVLEYGFAKSVGRKTRFQVNALRHAAIDCDAHRPPIKNPTLHWDDVERRRLAMDLLTGKAVNPPSSASVQLRRLTDAYSAYLRGDYQAVVAAWPNPDQPPNCPIELTVLLHSLANSDREVPAAWVKRLRTLQPNDAYAIEQLAMYRAARKQLQLESGRTGRTLRYEDFSEESKKRFANLLDKTESALKHLQTDPWGMASVSDSLIRVAVDLSFRLPKAAARLFPLMQTPFAGYRFEELRRASVVLIAEQIDAKTLLHELERIEPHVYWSESFLKTRADAYREARHPLADLAAQQLQDYRRNSAN